MTDAFIETTVLTDFLLKRDGSETAAAAAFDRFENKFVPQFAWKEFKRGPLKNFVWAHNKLADTQSLLATLTALQRLSRSLQRYLTSTAIQAVQTAFAGLFANSTELARRHGAKANLDAIHADALRLELKRIIFSAWNRRTALFGGPFHLLSCYPDAPLTEVSRIIKVDPRDCPKGIECCLKTPLVQRRGDLNIVREVLKANSDRQEIARRGRVIRQLEKHPTSLMDASACLSLGDAYFVLFCPQGCVILTTNLRDIEPMASALGITAEAP
jgi:hypothetical protein